MFNHTWYTKRRYCICLLIHMPCMITKSRKLIKGTYTETGGVIKARPRAVWLNISIGIKPLKPLFALYLAHCTRSRLQASIFAECRTICFSGKSFWGFLEGFWRFLKCFWRQEKNRPNKINAWEQGNITVCWEKLKTFWDAFCWFALDYWIWESLQASWCTENYRKLQTLFDLVWFGLRFGWNIIIPGNKKSCKQKTLASKQ